MPQSLSGALHLRRTSAYNMADIATIENLSQELVAISYGLTGKTPYQVTSSLRTCSILPMGKRLPRAFSWCRNCSS